MIVTALDFLTILCFVLWLCMFVMSCCLCLSFLSFMCFVSYELDLVTCLLFGGQLKILNFKFVNLHFGYLGICLI